MRRSIIVLALLLCVAMLAQTAPKATVHPAKDVRYLVFDSTAVDTIKGAIYDKGLVWMPSLADTTPLTELGFIVPPIKEACRDSAGTSVGIDVLWPATMKTDTLPGFIEHLIQGAKCR